MKPHVIKTDLGEELVVLTQRDYLALRARAGDEDAEDAMTALLVEEGRRERDAGEVFTFPGWFAEAATKGDGHPMRGLRKHRQMSQAAVAEAAGIAQGYYSDVERGAAVPTLDVLDRISAALDLDVAWLRALTRNRVVGA